MAADTRAQSRGGCGRITVDQRALDRHVGALVVRILSDPRHTQAVEAAVKAAKNRRRPLAAELAECEHLAEELSARLGRREIKPNRYDAAITPLDKRIAELEAELAELDATPAAVPDGAVAAASRDEWRARWDAALVPERRNFIRQALGGRRLVIKPANRDGRPKFDPARVVIEPS